MTAETACLLRSFPVRKTTSQKSAFRDWLIGILIGVGYTPQVEDSWYLAKNHNIIVGDVERASIVFTAHYDTPARLPLPNFIIPQNYLLTILTQLPLFLLLAISAAVAEGIILFLTDNHFLGFLTRCGVVILELYLIYAGPANPSNVNDNTSGVATLLEIALSLPLHQRDKVAFVFFDNEEKYLLGSTQFNKIHGKKMADTLLVNFDCVSDGEHIRFFPNKQLKKHTDLLKLLETAFQSQEGKTVEIVLGSAFYPSDQKHFPLGVGVAALRKGRLGLFLGRIHTSRDTVFQEENIELLRRGALTLAKSIPCQKEALV